MGLEPRHSKMGCRCPKLCGYTTHPQCLLQCLRKQKVHQCTEEQLVISEPSVYIVKFNKNLVVRRLQTGPSSEMNL